MTKQGFAVPLGRWLQGGLRGRAREVLLSSESRTRGILAPQAVERWLTAPGRRRDADLDLETWTLLSFELWCRRFVDA